MKIKKNMLMLICMVWVLISCEEKSKQVPPITNPELSPIPVAPSEPVVPTVLPVQTDKVTAMQIDTLRFVDFNDDSDDFYLTASKAGNNQYFIYNKDDENIRSYTTNDNLQITYAIDSVAMAGDEEVIKVIAVAKSVVKIGD